MESQMAHVHGHGRTQEQEPHIVGHNTEGEDEDHHEKKSVLTKVKVKARKIKDTLKKHGHGHNPDDHDHDHNPDDRDHDHVPDDHDLDEEDDDVEETVEDPEIHGAPIYEAAAIKSIGQVDSGVNIGRSTAMEVDHRIPNENPDEGLELDVGGQETSKGGQRVNLGLTTVMGEVAGTPQNTPVSHSTPGSHQTRDNDPTRTFVAGQEERPGLPKVNLQRPKGLEEDSGAPKDTPDTSANYQTKVTDPTGKGGEVAGITLVLHSFDKMNIYDESNPKLEHEARLPTGTQDFLPGVRPGSLDQFSPELAPPQRISTEDYPQMNMADRPSNQHDQFSPELTAPQSIRTEDDQLEDMAGRPSNQACYTEKISSATPSVSDKTISAKNIIASKLGHGEKENTGEHEMHGSDKNAMSASAVDYGKKMASNVTEKLSPVYKKFAGAGSTIMSKVHGTVAGNKQDGGVEGQDKGISVKDYFAEKLRPGEEDRALSEVISQVLHKRKVEQKKPETSKPVSEVISDALHKRKDEQIESDRPLGKVTESQEVASGLGTHEEKSPKAVNNKNISTSAKGMGDKFKVAVGSWFGRGEESQGSQQSLGSSFCSAIEGEGQDSSITGGRRLQESGN